jgi:hypothetical protein
MRVEIDVPTHHG